MLSNLAESGLVYKNRYGKYSLAVPLLAQFIRLPCAQYGMGGLGSQDATPLEFWIGVQGENQIELDDLVVVETLSPRGQSVRFFGIVDTVRKRYEGAQYDTDAFRAAAGTLPVDISYAAHVQVTRVDPEVFIPPHPGDAARVVRGEEFQRAL